MRHVKGIRQEATIATMRAQPRPAAAVATAAAAAAPLPPPRPSRSISSRSPPAGPPPQHYLVSPSNQSIQPALPGEVVPLRLGPELVLAQPLLAAPLAGVTAAPLRVIYTQAGASLAVSEMVIASTLRERSVASARLARWHAAEATRSAQLYGVSEDSLDWACRYLAQECGVHHIDLNFGCPVRKVTSRGGGAALPLRPRLFGRLVAAAVRAAGPRVALTVKLRVGLDERLPTCMQAGAIAASEGVSGIVLHARTAMQQYSPPADWGAIARLVAALPGVPIIGNGDVFEAADALRMMRETGCAGVMIGRAALGRPWLFTEASAMMSGRWPQQPPPPLAGVLELATQHLQAWASWEGDERSAVLQMRKLIPCYLAGFTTAGRLRGALLTAESVADWEAAVADPGRWGFNPDEPYALSALRAARLKGGSRSTPHTRVSLPQGWLQEGEDDDGVPDCLIEYACEG